MKAQIIGSVPKPHREAYTKKWEDTEEDLGRDAFGDLFSHIRMIYRKAKPHGSLLDEFKEHVIKEMQPEYFINEVLIPMHDCEGQIVARSRRPLRVTSRNTCGEQIKSALPSTGDLSKTSYTCRGGPIAEVHPLGGRVCVEKLGYRSNQLRWSKRFLQQNAVGHSL